MRYLFIAIFLLSSVSCTDPYQSNFRNYPSTTYQPYYPQPVPPSYVPAPQYYPNYNPYDYDSYYRPPQYQQPPIQPQYPTDNDATYYYNYPPVRNYNPQRRIPSGPKKNYDASR